MASSAARALRDAVSSNLARVRERLAAACRSAGRDPKDVSLVAVTKYGGPSLVEAFLELGVQDLGENRSERIVSLDAHFGARVRWHMIGHLQRNKARRVASALHALHSLDSLELAEKLDKRRAELSLAALPIYIEVNSGEEQKSGIDLSELEGLARSLSRMTSLRVEGLMTMAPETENPEGARPAFAALRALLPRLESALGKPARGLSMGMTHDLEIAIQEGATVVRVGRALLEGVPEEVLLEDRAELARPGGRKEASERQPDAQGQLGGPWGAEPPRKGAG